MQEKTLSIGFCAERPHSKWAHGEEGKRVREKQIEIVRKINEAYDEIGAARTFFVLGHYLEKCLEENGGQFSQENLNAVYNPNNPLVEIAQHGYGHLIFKTIKGREDRKPVSAEAFLMDINRATETIENILEARVRGIMTPLGYDQGLRDVRFEDMAKILIGLKKQGLEYVSSNLRGPDSLNAPVSIDRQPHHYGKVGFADIAEIPTHGWQDVIFTAEKAKKYLGREPASAADILGHYQHVLIRAKNLGLENVNVSLCMHPWAIMEYDPNLEIHKKIIDFARKIGYKIETFRDNAEKIRVT